VLPAAVQSVEDHGYILDFGIPAISGFLSFKEMETSVYRDRLPVGHFLDVCVAKVSENGRTCNVSPDPKLISSSFVRSTGVTLSEPI
jgi:rRNA biogenesis protein RRP5